MVDFGKIGNIMAKVMDSDYIDIKRDIDGRLQEVYSNIPCHIAYSSVDNPDPTTVDIKPIIQSLTVHCPLWVDLRNNDFIVAKKAGSDGDLIATYSGRCGNPVVSQGRKKVSVSMNATEPENPTPLPPKESVIITVKYFADGEEIQGETEIKAEAGKPFELEAPAIEGYSVIECYIDGEFQESTTAKIPEVGENGNEIKFVYAESETLSYFRFLVKGLYTKDNGSLANGWHLYKKTPAEVSVSGGSYTVTCADVKYVHADSGKTLAVEIGTKMALFPGKMFVEVKEIVSKENKTITFIADPFDPTEAELNAYECRWYD